MTVQYQFTMGNPPFSTEKEAILRYFLGRHIALPEVETPEVSIIIPVFNQYHYTIACLQSLQHACRGNVSYEVILADDASTDETCDIAAHVKNLRVIRNESAQHGFLPNVNFAAKFARGKYIFLLNNDTLLLENGGMLDRLTAWFQDPSIGVVGNRLRRADGTIYRYAWLILSSGIFMDLSAPAGSCASSLEGDIVEGSAFMLRSETWREMNGFDPIYERGYYEESDLCFRIKALKKKRIICDLRSEIIHFGHGTFQESPATKEAQRKHAHIFFQRWNSFLTAREAGLPASDPQKLASMLYAKLYR